jgi:hypothetical protein
MKKKARRNSFIAGNRILLINPGDLDGKADYGNIGFFPEPLFPNGPG